MTLPRSLLLPALVFAVSLVVTWLIWDHERQAARTEVNAQLDFALRGVSNRIEQRVLNFEQMLHGVQGLMVTTRIADRAAFRDYVQALQLDAGFSGVQAIGLVELVAAAGKDRHESQMRARAEGSYAIHPVGPGDVYAPIIQREPYAGRNVFPLGYDIWSEPERRAALERSRDTGLASITGRLRLLNDRESDASPGFVMYMPLYAAGPPPETVAARRAALIGWTFISFRVPAFMASLFSEIPPGLELRIFDGVGNAAANMIYRMGASGPSATQPSQVIDEYLVIAGRTWTLSMGRLADSPMGFGRNAATVIALGGTSGSALLGLLVWVMVTGRSRAMQMAERMTRELRESETRFRHLFENNGSIMLVIDPESGDVVSANRAALEYYGYGLDQLVGQPVSRINTSTAEEIAEEQQRALREERNYFKFLHRLASGEIRNVEVYSTPTNIGGKILLVSIVHDITERHQLEEKLQHLALHDPLTNLPNRALFNDHLLRQSTVADRRAEAIGLLFIDLDGFKEVNDRFGHQAGDQLLVAVAERLRLSLRAGDLPSRLGGDEFAMALSLTQADPFDEAARVAQRVLEALDLPVELDVGAVSVSASIGIAVYPHCAASIDQCLRLADMAMYAAKHAGKGRFVVSPERHR